MKGFMAITKALADENRVRIVMFLRPRELCLCQIIEMLQLAPSTVSKHMAVLSAAGLVASRKDGRWTYYCRSKARPDTKAAKTLTWLDATLSNDPTVRKDARRLRRIQATPVREFCAHYG